MRFSDLNISEEQIIGRKLEITAIFGRRVLIERLKIRDSKYHDSCGRCLMMQVCLCEFNAEPDENGDYFKKDQYGEPEGERRFVSTGSDVLIRQAEKVKEMIEEQGINKLRLDTTIQKVGKSYQFT